MRLLFYRFSLGAADDISIPASKGLHKFVDAFYVSIVLSSDRSPDVLEVGAQLAHRRVCIYPPSPLSRILLRSYPNMLPTERDTMEQINGFGG
jgi:hypothetical protein